MSSSVQRTDIKTPNTLFAYLHERGIRQRWLADRMEISEQYLTHIKVGRKPMPSWFCAKAAAALGVPEFLLFPEYIDEEPAHV